MVAVIIILIGVAIIYYKNTIGSDNAKMVRALTQGKTKTQADVITYFKREGCGAKTITDSQYYDIVYSARSHYNSIQKALDKIGLDADEVREIPPVYFEGFRGENAYTKQTASGRWVSTTYEIAWLFFSDSQVHVYRRRFNLDDDYTTEITDEYFYKDITAFTTISEEEVDRDGKRIPTTTFRMRGAGIEFECSLSEVKDFETAIRGMKQKLREKKNA